MYLGSPAQTGGAENIQAYFVVVEGFFLSLVVLLHEVVDSPLEALLRAQLAVAFRDGGAVAVRAGNEDDIFIAQPVAQESRINVRKHEHSADVTEMQLLVAVGHAAGDYRTLREFRAWYFVLYEFLFLFAHCLVFPFV